ncbi:hypothetical protein HK405_015556 [Cladochytrium tenue]|nr:hypothetical protein HK405_015556 [Cladochytrium tenue]
MSTASVAPVTSAPPLAVPAAATGEKLPPAVSADVNVSAVTACPSPLFVVCSGAPPMAAAQNDNDETTAAVSAATTGASSSEDDVSDAGSTLLTAPGSPPPLLLPPDECEQQQEQMQLLQDARKKSISFSDVVELIEALPDEEYDRSAEPVVKLTYKDMAELMAMRSEFAKASAAAAASAATIAVAVAASGI